MNKLRKDLCADAHSLLNSQVFYLNCWPEESARKYLLWQASW